MTPELVEKVIDAIDAEIYRADGGVASREAVAKAVIPIIESALLREIIAWSRTAPVPGPCIAIKQFARERGLLEGE